MNPTVALLTARTLLGRRRAAVLILLPAALLGAAIITRLTAGTDHDIGTLVLGAFALGTVVPLLGLIIGTGAIGPEIDDGSIVYLLTKPLNRTVIALTKYAVAAGTLLVFAVLPTFATGLILFGRSENLAAGYTVAALVAGLAYAALFLALAVASRNAVVVGLSYALIWESLIGAHVSGAQTLSVLQWARAVAGGIVGTDQISSAVSLTTGIIGLGVVIVGALWFAGHRLRSLRPISDS
ncbi:MAG: hypothetical protein P8Z68_05805 [Kineosporiaceae bacterium]|jgi:ABC-2 type transport system permease protein